MSFDSRGIPLSVLVVVSVVAVAGPGAAAATTTGAEAPGVQCSFPFTKTDATGNEVTVETEPQTVVTLAPSAAQTMWEIGAKEKVVGVSKSADYLDGFEKRVNVGSGFSPAVEKIIALDPDLVLAPAVVPEKVVQSLREKGLTVYLFEDATSMEDVVRKTRLIGKLVGECEGAEETATWMENQLARIRQAVQNVDRPRVLYEFSGGYTAAGKTFIHDMIRTAGGKNIAAQGGKTGYYRINSETVLKRDPQFLIQSSRSPKPPDKTEYLKTTAVSKGNVIVIDVDYLNQPAPRSIYAIWKMLEALHPEAYEEARATPTPTSAGPPSETGTSTGMMTATETPAGTETSNGAPGFGVAAALLALLGAALLAARR